MKSKARFNKAMATLHGYSLIEAMPGHYSLHACVHDWVLEYLIGRFDMTLFGLAIHCIAQNVAWDSMPEYWLINGRLNHHTLRMEHCQQKGVVDWNFINMDDIDRIGYLNNTMGRLKEGEAMYMRALKGKEKAWGAEIRLRRGYRHACAMIRLRNPGSVSFLRMALAHDLMLAA